VPGAAFYFDRSGHDHLRLSYSLAADAEIDAGIARLAALIGAAAS
jgi:DNA-binding transcriptional MocR family regulator